MAKTGVSTFNSMDGSWEILSLPVFHSLALEERFCFVVRSDVLYYGGTTGTVVTLLLLHETFALGLFNFYLSPSIMSDSTPTSTPRASLCSLMSL